MDSSARWVLFVDDQQVARKYFTLMFGSEYHVLTAPSAEEAWVTLGEHGERLSVIITDQRMGQRSGVDLLMAVRHRYPHIVRLLTTGYADLDAAIDAVHRGDIHAYIQKPWNADEFAIDIRRAAELHDLQRERDSLLDLQARTERRALSADRLRMYGMMAAVCSGWVHDPLRAVLAFWSDAHKHGLGPFTVRSGNRRVSDRRVAGVWPTADEVEDTIVDHTGEMLGWAADLGSWIAAHRRSGDFERGDAATVAQGVAADLGLVFRGPPAPVMIPHDAGFLAAGLRMLVAHLAGGIAARGREGAIDLAAAATVHGGLAIDVQWRSVGSAVDAAAVAWRGISCPGLKAYLAIHHHGGEVAVRTWDADGGAVRVLLPPCRPTGRSDATEEFREAMRRREVEA